MGQMAKPWYWMVRLWCWIMKADRIFRLCRADLKNKAGQLLAYMVFDLLAFEGEDLRTLRLIERKEKLEALLKGRSVQYPFQQPH